MRIARRTLMAVILFSLCAPALAQSLDVKIDGNLPEIHKFEAEVTKKAKLDYLVYLPEGYDASEKEWPVLFWLHGDGAQPLRGGLAELRSYGPPKMSEQGWDHPFIIVAPQLWGEVHWDPDTLHAVLKKILADYRVDEDRVYLMGYSRGGFGTWEFACSYPEYFAAVVPISARAMTAIERIKDVPIWIFHGAKDTGVPVEGAKNMHAELKSVGTDVRFTLYPNVGHNACDPAMKTPELWAWLAAQERGGGRPSRAPQSNSSNPNK